MSVANWKVDELEAALVRWHKVQQSEESDSIDLGKAEDDAIKTAMNLAAFFEGIGLGHLPVTQALRDGAVKAMSSDAEAFNLVRYLRLTLRQASAQ